MQRPAPFPSLPIRRKRRSRLPVIAAVLFAVFTVFVVASMIRDRQRPVAEETIGRADTPAVLTPSVPTPAKPATTSIILPGKQPSLAKKTTPQAIKPLKAMPASEVRGEFDKAAAVLRRYFQSPTEEELKKLLRHPAETLPRHRSWTAKRHIVPSVPLQIGPQFGVSGSLLVTSMKLADGSMRLVALEHTDQGYRLDWESFSAWGERYFADLASLDDEKTALLRVTVKPSSATPPFAGSAASFTLSHPDERATLAAYAVEDVLARSPAGRTLRNASGGMFTLRLRVDDDDAKHGWAEIAEVVSVGWVAELSAKE